MWERKGKGTKPGHRDGIAGARLWIRSRETPGDEATSSGSGVGIGTGRQNVEEGTYSTVDAIRYDAI